MSSYTDPMFSYLPLAVHSKYTLSSSAAINGSLVIVLLVKLILGPKIVPPSELPAKNTSEDAINPLSLSVSLTGTGAYHVRYTLFPYEAMLSPPAPAVLGRLIGLVNA